MTDLLLIVLATMLVFMLGMCLGAWIYYRGQKKLSPMPENPIKSALKFFNNSGSNTSDEEFERTRTRKVRA